MPDFKGRKDFPEVADAKIKIGDYSGTNRLAVTDIYSPKSEPTLRDQMIEPVKGNKQNNYDSPILSQQPVIVLSDVEAEANIINAIDGYLGKADQDVSRGFEDTPPVEMGPPAGMNERDWGHLKMRAAAKQGAPGKRVQKQMPGVGMPSAETKPKAPTETKIPDVGGGWRGTSQAKPKAQAASPSAPATSLSPRTPGIQPTTGHNKAHMVPSSQMKKPQQPYSAFDQAGGAGAPVKTTPGHGLDQGPGLKQRAAEAGARAGKAGAGKLWGGVKGLARGAKEQAGAVGQAAKVGVQQGIRHGVEGAYEQGPEADARRAEQAGKVYRNKLTATAASGARRLARLGGVKQVARGLGFGRTKREEDAMRTRHEYADADDLSKEMMLSDILHELESYIEQPTNDVAERQLTKGNFSKMMRNTEDKAPKDWKYHV